VHVDAGHLAKALTRGSGTLILLLVLKQSMTLQVLHGAVLVVELVTRSSHLVIASTVDHARRTQPPSQLWSQIAALIKETSNGALIQETQTLTDITLTLT